MQEFYIWSFEHQAWWKPDRNGYTNNRMLAGRYSLDEALRICRDANCWFSGLTLDKAPAEAMVPA